jgi:hypothetical protein
MRLYHTFQIQVIADSKKKRKDVIKPLLQNPYKAANICLL